MRYTKLGCKAIATGSFNASLNFAAYTADQRFTVDDSSDDAVQNSLRTTVDTDPYVQKLRDMHPKLFEIWCKIYVLAYISRWNELYDDPQDRAPVPSVDPSEKEIAINS